MVQRERGETAIVTLALSPAVTLPAGFITRTEAEADETRMAAAATFASTTIDRIASIIVPQGHERNRQAASRSAPPFGDARHALVFTHVGAGWALRRRQVGRTR